MAALQIQHDEQDIPFPQISIISQWIEKNVNSLAKNEILSPLEIFCVYHRISYLANTLKQ